jgi:anthranilate phosphoribosyltransferase
VRAVLKDLLKKIDVGRHLTDTDVAGAVEALAGEHVPAMLKADFLTALAKRGETTAEIVAFARQLRGRSVQPHLHPATRQGEILDVCGTGGDRLNTFNISTTVSILIASAGVTVAKHGNRAVTSRAGSADVLEVLGIPIELSPDEAAHWLEKHKFAFFFAPFYHPAFKHIAPARKLCSTRGVRTIFNFLGPLLNPAQPTAQLIGVPHPELCEPLAAALQQLGARRGMIVSGKVQLAWLDEFSPMGETHSTEFDSPRGLATTKKELSLFPVQPCSLTDLQGGNAELNAGIVRAILTGAERGPKRDAVLLNAAAALHVAGLTRSLPEGWKIAADLIDRGAAQAKLAELVAAGKNHRPAEPAAAP